MRAITAVLLATIAVTSSALSTGGRGTTAKKNLDRRGVLASLLLGGGGSLIASDANAAIDVYSQNRSSTPTDKSIFLGTYTDPVNHPGGTRTIDFSGTKFGGYELATVKGGGGRGEPKSFELPAMVFKCPGNQEWGGRWCITVDFSPKGGPKDFQGYYDEDKKGIRWVLDNNFWPLQ
jgi:hypothetical protein